jgi:hypothetical protein
MSWASGRQAQYIFGLFLFLGLVAFVIAWPSITRKPTCADGKQNGGENGVDCGGVCQRICNTDASEPIILWKRAFPVTGNVYNLVAFIENRNKDAGIQFVTYEFRVYDTKNILIGRRSGKTFIPPNQQFAIFESRFDSGQSEIKSVTFDFTSPFVWLKKAPTLQTLPIKVEDVILSGDKSSPSIKATISNESIYDLPEFDVVAIVYDINHNAINASRTHKDGLLSNGKTLLFFTWPNPFIDVSASKDILVQINPFTVSF